ncbi:polynucleotide 3'-phosphatase /polynucleotide 5'-hydroxyl-kinase /polynucleotide 2',3'-cyclic phosphate phosphodiesterase [Bacillus sp. OV166]|uniref:polynucleotide kinase-phosphatase n=1 Tax=Bacillus sp. OV166 TaxID=1882763 RepID=UPI000A2AE2F0|nr:polynucleotide kinase-phosphatase [Bacillus sp. OV166]SMQ81843.1 polynucleotide 3'-phosphatase /polynucleotide 5'-hydroxyl-kinase /polynucleotide 2',3'-cyclic phosphate phosphodiesterase [Bacillus sp. OV166]
MAKINLPHAGIVLLVGPSNSGKTTLINQLIQEQQIYASEVVSSDQFRVLVSDIEFIDWNRRPKYEADALFNEYQQISKEAFEAMDYIIAKRCRLNKLTFIDATHLRDYEREKYLQMAKRYHVPAIAIVLNLAETELLRRDLVRDFPRGKNRIKQQYQHFKKTLRSIKKEGFRRFYIFGEEELQVLNVNRLGNPLLIDVGNGIDFIGDIHGCFEEFREILSKLGYIENEEGYFIHPEGRKILSLGDVMSRGPRSIETLQFFQKHVAAGLAYMIDSNHGWKIARWLDGKDVKLAHGDENVKTEFDEYESKFGKDLADRLKEQIRDMLLEAKSHYIIQNNGVNVAVAVHAGIKDHYIGKQSPRISDFCRYGDSDGLDENGKPVRKDWSIAHQSSELILWGHDPRTHPLLVNNTLNIDQGVVFGGNLTAYCFPERKFVSVKAKADYANVSDNPLKVLESKRLAPPNIAKFLEGYSVLTELYGEIAIYADSTKSALDDLSHYTLPLEEIVYLPPTMSPTPKPSSLAGYLEHPIEAFEYYQANGVDTMVVEKKHMGSRGILLLFKNKEIAKDYIGRETLGSIYTRTGRAFFKNELEEQILQELNIDLSGYFEKYNTDFVLMDAEILPWNLKAKELIMNQYAHVGEMALLDRSKLQEQLKKALDNGKDVSSWLEETSEKIRNAQVFNEVYQKYCWETEGLAGIEIAPFHTLAHSNETFFDKPHTWHMEKNKEFSVLSDLFMETEYRIVNDEDSMKSAIEWWEEMTEDGHEGFVVKPESYVARYKGKLLQPAIKVRGRKYLHIIYGIDYLQPENLSRLKQRNAGKKQRNALKEFALGVEAVNRFVRKESLERYHECVLAVLALESDPIDPRL